MLLLLFSAVAENSFQPLLTGCLDLSAHRLCFSMYRVVFLLPMISVHQGEKNLLNKGSHHLRKVQFF